ncbi:hypothetical protein N658DRAFT_496827 [Parathielavia hyrcaniae]|uniref:RING-type E3 ubiquitin transferase n=1 Tax=Parathielavia hyrcaniae TaxID=113614 RepID=A0AAN6T208_9PEZI|nr:hypothetical protein N658DRAFT_496827 [Parathielavia hyrcaniae]
MADRARRDQETMYCHACHHQWQGNAESIECPACRSASTEIIDLANDPRHFHNRQPAQETASSIATPAAAMANPEPAPAPRAHGASESSTTASPPANTNTPLNNNTQSSTGTTNSGNGDAPRRRRGSTFHFFVPQLTFTFVTTSSAPSSALNPPLPPAFYTMHFHPIPMDPPPTANNTPPTTSSGEANTDNNNNTHASTTQPHQPSESHLHQQPPPIGPFPADAPPAGSPVSFITSLMTSLFNPAAAAIYGDAVYSQEAFDRIMTQLRDQVPPGGAPPASQAALGRLRTREVDEKMLVGAGSEDGKAKCVVCVDDMVKGDKAAVLPCDHFFHEECVVPWLKLHGTCPMCRRSVEVEGDVGKGTKVERGAQVGGEQRQERMEGDLGDAMDCA